MYTLFCISEKRNDFLNHMNLVLCYATINMTSYLKFYVKSFSLDCQFREENNLVRSVKYMMKSEHINLVSLFFDCHMIILVLYQVCTKRH